MATWLDFVALLVTSALFVGVIYGVVRVINIMSEAVASTKESLKSKGLDITDKGVSLKTSKRYDREDYIDSTQRGIIKAMGAASFGTSDSHASSPASSPATLTPQRQDSGSSIPSVGEEKEKKGRFGIRRAFSKSSE